MGKTNVKVSIIIPVYNVELYLRECLDSVVSQSYDNVEIILIDDGSTDSSCEICDEYKYRKDNIIVWHQTNLGVSQARNKGIELSSGSYLVFVDPDDVVSGEYIEKMVSLVEDYECDLGGIGYCTEKKLLNHKGGGECVLFEGKDVKWLRNKLIMKNNDKRLNGYLWTHIFSKNIIVNNNIRFESGVTVWEDMLFIIQYMAFVVKYCYISDILYYYRQHSASAINSFGIDKYKSKMIVNERLMNICEAENGTYDQLLLREYIYSALDYGYQIRFDKKEVGLVLQMINDLGFERTLLDFNRLVKYIILKLSCIRKSQ